MPRDTDSNKLANMVMQGEQGPGGHYYSYTTDKEKSLPLANQALHPRTSLNHTNKKKEFDIRGKEPRTPVNHPAELISQHKSRTLYPRLARTTANTTTNAEYYGPKTLWTATGSNNNQQIKLKDVANITDNLAEKTL